MSAIEEKGLPSNLDAERFVLGSILMDDSQFVQAAGDISAEDFSLEKHRRIFHRMGELSAQGERIDRVTVANELMRYNELESCDGLSYLVSLDDGLPKIFNLDSYIRIVKDKALLRRIMFTSQHLMNRCLLGEEGPEELLALAEHQLREMGDQSGRREEMRSPLEIIEALGGIEKFCQKPPDGVSTPWPTISRLTRGLQRGNLILLGGRPSAGKTTAALNIVVHAVRRGVGTLLFSLETPDRDLLQQLVCIASEIRLADFRDGLKSDERKKIMEAITLLSTGLRISSRPLATARSVHSEVRRLQAQHNIGLVVIDYLQLMDGGAHQDRWVEVGLVSRQLKLAALALNVPFLVLSQVNRDADGRRPILKDLRESGNLEQDADVVMFISPKLDKPGYSEIGVAKQRSGPAGDDCWIEVRFRKEHGQISEETNEQEDSNSAFVNGLRAALR